MVSSKRDKEGGNLAELLISETCFGHFAELFEYPTEGYTDKNEQLLDQMKNDENSLVVDELLFFTKYVQGQSLRELQSNYTSTFDINPPLPIYVGYYLFGESYIRSLFLMELNNRFKKYNYSWNKELSDHISVILRFIDEYRESELADELISGALIPMLDRVSWKNIKPEDQFEHIYPGYAYYRLLNALRIYILQTEGKLDDYNLSNLASDPISLDMLQESTTPDRDIDTWLKKGDN